MSNLELVSAIRSSLPDGWGWTERDEVVLRLAEAQAQDLDVLEGRDDLAGIRERRFQRLALVRIVGTLDLPEHATTATLKAQKAARARWHSAAS